MPYRHFSDLVRGPEDGAAIISKPLSSLIDEAEAAANLARASVSSGKLDNALEAYIKDGEILLPWAFAMGKVIPQHRNYADGGNSQRCKRITDQLFSSYDTFEKIKEIIKEDNAKSGVRPTPTRVSFPPLQRTQASKPAPASNDVATSKLVMRSPPTTTASKAVPQVPPKPPKLRTSVDAVINSMPKVPDAIYSPARGNLSNEAADLPSSTPRGMFSRTGLSAASFPSKPNSPNPNKSPSAEAALDSRPVTSAPAASPQRTAHYRILLIDVRSRASFEDGHIFSSATICVESEVIQRPHIEASDVEDSMEVGATEEKRLFEKRHDFDMIVIYDQNSQSLGSDRISSAAKMFSVLTDFDYPEGDPASKHPKLLKGGLDAWSDMIGGNSLQTSSHKRKKSTYDKPWLKSPIKPIQDAEEARRWEEKLEKPKQEDGDSPDGPDWTAVRTVSDFLTRFPPVQESMTSPVKTNGAEVHRPPPVKPIPPPHHRPADYPLLPSEPMRPPPAVPRRSFTGLQPPDDEQGTSTTKVVTRTDTAARRRAVGLRNPGNWCYANSTLQALFASGGFGEELFTQAWQKLYKPQKKADEQIQPPQLLIKILSNLFLWMGTAKFVMTADTLMITSKGFKGQRPEDQILGGDRQMDAHEFLVRLFTELSDETNQHRDRPDEILPPPPTNKSILEGAVDIWNLYSQANNSIIDKYWQTLECLITRCDRCGHVAYRVDPPKNHLVLSLPETNQPQSIEGLLSNYFSAEALDDYKCDGCGRTGACRRTPRFARLPDLLCIVFGRFENRLRKNSVYIDFPHRDLDLTPYSIQGQQPYSSSLLTSNSTRTTGNATDQPLTSPTAANITDHHFTKPFKYDAYAVVQHGGQLLGGHYISIIREGGPDEWRIADDSRIQPIGLTKTLLQRQGGMDAYMVFYQRKDIGLV
ncbi:cysteine proteinase [Cryphonectria parasitica EP155]|uniref:Cysteine proteinase n=1 Tax=Cryphonectria parasitica (strain ATCC 38755 / EP155) TaxID=660469 RepID=A0A9P4XW08_CRYP1|nr:cysteine proteinase [Cryphonectria parasitica EP155]KAF3761984.1 cysteine proteinase [Cryphonectria parasitica EP155]